MLGRAICFATVIGISAILLGAFMAESEADTIVTQGGGRWEGTVKDDGDSYLLIKPDGGKMRFPKSAVKEVVRAEVEHQKLDGGSQSRKENVGEPPSSVPPRTSGPSRARNGAATAPSGKQKTISYPSLGASSQALIARLLSEGYLRGGGYGATDIQVSDDIQVTGVPKKLIAACARRAAVTATAWTDFARGNAGTHRILRGARLAEALGGCWTDRIVGAIAAGQSKGLKAGKVATLSRRAVIALDAKAEGLRKSECAPSTNWLLADDVTGGSVLYPSFKGLLDRFEPKAPVEESNAVEVAEEIVWTQAMDLGNGTRGALPEARVILQAAILAGMGFDTARVLKSATIDDKALSALQQAKDAFHKIRGEGKARSKLSLARMYMQSESLRQKGRSLLKEIIEEFPDAEAGIEARKLLEGD